jgi:RimJ/RimL family protein N-acetyltransferase
MTNKYKEMIRLQKFTKSDYDRLILWIDSKETLMQFAGPGFTFPLTSEQLEESLIDKNRYAFTIIDADSGNYIGHSEIFLTGTSASLGRILIGDYQLRGKGLGKEIVLQLLEYSFNTLGQRQVELNVFDWNIGAIRCYEKVGFTINPYKKLERKINGETWIALNMALDKQKWNEQNEYKQNH